MRSHVLTGRRRFAVLTAVAAGALALSLSLTSGGGVGGSGVARAAAKTQSARTARFTVDIRQPSTPPESTSVQGAISFQPLLADMTFVTVNGQLRGRIVLEGTTWYVQLPGLLQLGQGKSWVKVDASKLGRHGLQALQALTTFDPRTLFQLLGDAGHFDAIGTEQVRGVATTHYHGSVQVGKLAAAIGSAPEASATHANDEFAVDAWVDHDGYLRKVHFDLPTSQDGPGTSVDIELYDFGAPVEVSPPPADQVEDLAAMLATGSASGTATGDVNFTYLHTRSFKARTLPAGQDGKLSRR